MGQLLHILEYFPPIFVIERFTSPALEKKNCEVVVFRSDLFPQRWEWKWARIQYTGTAISFQVGAETVSLRRDAK